jgi:hypothetical protein
MPWVDLDLCVEVSDGAGDLAFKQASSPAIGVGVTMPRSDRNLRVVVLNSAIRLALA